MSTSHISLRNVLALSPGLQGSRPAIVLPESAIRMVDHLSATIRSEGLPEHSTVAIVMANGAAFLVAFLAVVSAGFTAAPLNAQYTQEELHFYLSDTQARLVLLEPVAPPAAVAAAAALALPVWRVPTAVAGLLCVTRDTHPPAQPQPQPQPQPQTQPQPQPQLPSQHAHPHTQGDGSERVALVLHTSGTTARPKLVPLTHANVLASVRNVAATYALSAADTALLVMPLFHVHGLIGCALPTLATGGCLALPARFSASAFWGQARAAGASWYTAVPTIHQVLLARHHDPARPPAEAPAPLRFIRSCSASLSPATLADLQRSFGCPVLEAYGMTEAAHQMTSNPLAGPHKPASVGRGTSVHVRIAAADGAALAAGERGEVCVAGPNVTPGYHNNAAANAANFFLADGLRWLRTGDQGFLDPDGFLFLTGRIKELINRGGEKISPLEVDAALLECEGVAEAVSFAVPDAKYGEEVHAAVVPRPGAALSAPAILAAAATRLAAFKLPKHLYIADSLPKTATGKVQRGAIAKHFLQLQQPSAS